MINTIYLQFGDGQKLYSVYDGDEVEFLFLGWISNNEVALENIETGNVFYLNYIDLVKYFEIVDYNFCLN